MSGAPTTMTVGELRTLIASISGLAVDDIGPVTIVVGVPGGDRAVAVIPPMLTHHKPDWKQAIELMAAGIAYTIGEAVP